MTSGWRALRLVAGREIREALRGKAFWLTSGAVFVGSAGLMIVPELLEDSGRDRYDVAVVDGSPALAEALVAGGAVINADIDLIAGEDAPSARTLVDEDVADLAIVTGDPATIYVKAGKHERLLGVARQSIASAGFSAGVEQLDLTPDDVQTLLSVPEPRLEELDTGGESRRGAAFGLSLVMYLVLLMLMVQVSGGVAVEKANRISEVLLAIVHPGALLFGKVLGVAVIGTLTVLAGAVPIVAKMVSGGDLPDGIGGALVAGGAWFLLGAALYLVLAGALGALVERQEEAGGAVTPLNLTLVGAYLVGGSAPESTASQVLSLIPLTAPMAMPSRIAIGEASVVEMVASLVLSILAVVVAARFAAVVYRRGIVRTGRRLKLRDVLRTP